MAESKIRASDQVMSESISNELIPNTEIELVKLAEVVIKADGTQALTGNWDIGSVRKITGSPTPTTATDVANKSYVDNLIGGHSWKDPVIKIVHYVKTTAGAPTGTATATECCLNTSDQKIYVYTTSWDAGTSLTTGDRYLFAKDGSDTSGGSGTYVADMKIYQKYASATTGTTPSVNWAVLVEKDSYHVDGDTQWTYDAETLTWVQISAAPSKIYKVMVSAGDTTPGYAGAKIGDGDGLVGTTLNPGENEVWNLNVGAGDGIEVSSLAVSVKLNGSTLDRSSSGLKVSSGGISAVEIATDAVTPFKLKGYNEPVDGYLPTYRNATQNFEWKALSAITDYKVKVTSDDTTPNYLDDKILNGDGITGTTTGGGVNETKTLAANIDVATGLKFDGSSPKKIQINYGDGLTASGNQVLIGLDGSTLAKSGSGLKVSSGGISSTEIATDAVTPFKLKGYDEPADGEIPTYRNATQNFEWKNITALDTYKVKADSGDVTPDYLDGKVDAHSIIVNGSDKIEVDVTNIIDTNYGLTEDTNNIRLNLDASGGLEYNSGALRVKLNGSTLDRSSSGLKVSSGGISAVEIATDAVTPFKLKGYNEPVDGYVPTYRNTTQNFEWKTQGAILTPSAIWENESSNCNGANTSFTLDYSPVLCADSTHHILWCLHNTTVRTEGAGLDFTVSGVTVTTNFTPKTGDTLIFFYFK